MNDDAAYDGGDLHRALVIGLARWICQQCLGVNAPGTDREAIAARAREIVAGFGASSSALRAPLIASDAEALADEHMETDVNWEQWAFGH